MKSEITYQEWLSRHVFTRQRQADIGYVAMHESVPASQYDAHLYSRYADLPADTQAAIDGQFAYRFSKLYSHTEAKTYEDIAAEHGVTFAAASDDGAIVTTEALPVPVADALVDALTAAGFTRLAIAWARRYGMPSVSAITGWTWTVHDSRGITQAQVSILPE